MSASEVSVLIISLIISVIFCGHWYTPMFRIWPRGRNLSKRAVLAVLPLAAAALTAVSVGGLDKFGLIGNIFHTLMYVFLGFTWLYAGLLVFSVQFEMSWTDDVMTLGNKSALCVISGAFLGIALIFSGAAGSASQEGRSWWHVLILGGLGCAVWSVICLLLRKTGVFERVGVDRDTPSGIRAGAFMLAGGLILARAAGVEWAAGAEITALTASVTNFLKLALPVTLLAAVALPVEIHYAKQAEKAAKVAVETGHYRRRTLLSPVPALIYAAIGIGSFLFYS